VLNTSRPAARRIENGYADFGLPLNVQNEDVEYIAIAVGGTYECWARYGSPTIYEHDFPHATLRTNVLGSFLMAFPLIETFEPLERLTIAPEHRSGLLIGPLREFTTFSTFSLETMLLVVLCCFRGRICCSHCARGQPCQLSLPSSKRRGWPGGEGRARTMHRSCVRWSKKGAEPHYPNHRHFGYQPGNKQRNKSDEDRFMHSRLHFQLARMRAYSG
jgi:fluoride ion exporter CrcB/FEX